MRAPAPIETNPSTVVLRAVVLGVWRSCHDRAAEPHRLEPSFTPAEGGAGSNYNSPQGPPNAPLVPYRGPPTHKRASVTRRTHNSHCATHTHTRKLASSSISCRGSDSSIHQSTAAHTPASAAYRSYTYCGAVAEVSIIRVLTHSTDCCRRIPFKRQPS
jgi:hypothetical protein